MRFSNSPRGQVVEAASRFLLFAKQRDTADDTTTQVYYGASFAT